MSFEYPNQFEPLFAPTAEWGTQKVKPELAENMDTVIARFPKTRYYGSKRRLLGCIYHALKDLPVGAG